MRLYLATLSVSYLEELLNLLTMVCWFPRRAEALVPPLATVTVNLDSFIF